jgi:hypothetical protein
MSAEQKLIPEGARCECPRCEQSRWIKHLRSLLPEKESQELCDWYNALLDSEEDQSLTLYHYAQKLKEYAHKVEVIATT